MEHMSEGAHSLWMTMVPVAIVLVLISLLVMFFARRSPQQQHLPVTSLTRTGVGRRLHRRAAAMVHGTNNVAGAARDMVFVLPDISHYTRFMTVNRFAFGHAQHIVFELINAMIDAATPTVRLSKLEGDAALFYADPAEVGSDAIGAAVMDIFAAFFQAQQKLLASNICPCTACQHILDLDLKVLVHRGEASPFEFRGAVDFFGMDMIVLHRLLKNTVRSHRYIMITQAAGDLCRLPLDLPSRTISETFEHIGPVPAVVFELDDAEVERMRKDGPAERVSQLRETWRKIAQNVATLVHAPFGRGAGSE